MADFESSAPQPPNSNYLLSLPPSPPSLDPPPPPPPIRPLFPFSKRPPIRVTSEFDSESSIFFHKVSCKLLDNLAKIKFSFQNDNKGQITDSQLQFRTKYLSIHYDPDEHNALLRSSIDVGPRLHFRAAHDIKGQQGELGVVAKIADPGYALELSSPVPAIGAPRATFKFPMGEISLEEREEEEVNRAMSINGVLKGQFLNGNCAAHYKDEELELRYSYKDEALSFIPKVSLPSNALSFAFKRRFGPSDKLSYWYDFDSNDWSAVYKHTYGKDLKLKAGYDTKEKLGWASLWVGDEGGKAKTAPMKMKVQFMLQVPQDDIRSAALMFRVKKRWDI
ncbi:hypothetical protein IC582_010077 [Cucumis melo]|uniref:Outer envelope pore protein 37, chloroplastic n=1 Tax=Cucumis melo TaxID=3656 RepID=A0A1S3BM14_CUCME|nr:outer envelope pore protein 37, chloroplastic [Cucumis melo]